MSGGHQGARGRRRIPYKQAHSSDASGPQSDINVTPLVDVCLVLLIIFMVVTPMLGRGRDVRLPVVAVATAHKEGDQVFISVDNEGVWVEQDLYLERETFLLRVEEDLKVAAGKAAAHGDKGPLLFLKGDYETNYGRVRVVMEWLNKSESKLQDIALVVDIAEGGSG